MTDQHPITPPPSLMRQWREQAPRFPEGDAGREERLIERAAQWGYDQRGEVNEAKLQKARDEELEACYGWLVLNCYGEAASRLRDARRQKPPSLKEQALNALSHLIDGAAYSMDTTEPAEYIRRALEALTDD